MRALRHRRPATDRSASATAAAGSTSASAEPAPTEIICLDQATVIDTDPGDVLTEHTLDPARTYRRKNG